MGPRQSISATDEGVSIEFGPRRDPVFSLLIAVWLTMLALVTASLIFGMLFVRYDAQVYVLFALVFLPGLTGMWIFGLRIYDWNAGRRQRVFVRRTGIDVSDVGRWVRRKESLVLRKGDSIWVGTPAPFGLHGQEFIGMGTWNVELRGDAGSSPLLARVNQNEATEIVAALEDFGVPVIADETLRLGLRK